MPSVCFHPDKFARLARVGSPVRARRVHMAPLKGYQKRLDDVISRMGRQPHSSVPIERTAYATMWFGPSMSAAIWSLHVMSHTLRQHDRVRELIVLTPQSSDSELQLGRFAQLRREAAPLSYLQVRPLNTAESASATCQRTRNLSTSAGLRHASNSAYAAMWSKFHVWNLTRFERVLYIDADAMILHPLDRLWSISLNERQLFAAAHTLSPAAASYLDANTTGGWTGEPSCRKQFPKASWNAGVLLLRPSGAVMEEIVRNMGSRHLSYKCDNGDQSFFNFILRHYGACFRSTFNCYHPAVVTAPTALQVCCCVILTHKCVCAPWFQRAGGCERAQFALSPGCAGDDGGWTNAVLSGRFKQVLTRETVHLGAESPALCRQEQTMVCEWPSCHNNALWTHLARNQAQYK